MTKQVWTKGTTTDDVFVGFFRVRTTESPRIRMSYLALGTANLKCRRAWRYSNDGVTWTTPVGFGALAAVEGSWQWSTGYLITLTNYQWVEYGIVSKNNSGTAMESGRVRALLEVRDDKLCAFGAPPTSWGTLESGLLRASADQRITYYNANDPIGDVYDTPGSTWSLAAVSQNTGDASGPGAWGTYPLWIGYDDGTRTWNVYKYTVGTGVITVGTGLVGEGHAIAKVSVSSGTATFAVSYDGVSWTTLYSEAGSWTKRAYVVQNATFYQVVREERL